PEPDHRPGQKNAKRKQATQNNRSISPVTGDIIELIALSLEDITDDEGYGMLSALGTLLLKKRPDFDSRNYGFKKLSSMIQSIPRFEVLKQGTTTYIRDLQAK
ncbi:MAG: OST-HTH/LOTUS domain-containing protein, partial [Clostridiales bacterium]|nr:OST-HTH/LOTUS domain-containing protein [Clostridiales bacterium]